MRQLLDDIIAKNKDKIMRTCLGFAASSNQADDLFQEVCINIWLGLKKFRQEASISTWVYRVTVNTCLMHQRKHKINQEISIDEVADADWEDSASSTESEEKITLLRRLIQELPNQDKTIMILYLEDLPHTEIAAVTGLSENYVGVKIHRIKKVLTKKFEKYGSTTGNVE